MKDLALLTLRVVAGGTMAAHGYTKLFGGEGKSAPATLTNIYGPNFAKAVEAGGPANFAQVLEKLGVPYPQVAAYISGAAELGGGLALVAGMKTRLAALLVMANLAVAIGKVHWKNGYYGEGGYELGAQLFAAAAALFLAGPGALSVDGMLAGGRRVAGAVESAVPPWSDD